MMVKILVAITGAIVLGLLIAIVVMLFQAGLLQETAQ